MRLELKTSISKIKVENWPQQKNPLASYEFLNLFEDSSVATAKNGWQPLHFCLYDKDSLLAIIPSYIKSHSYGEYVFDWAWADFYQQQGVSYYPKLLSATPLTPCLAPKVVGSLNSQEQMSLFHQLASWCQDNQLSSWHLNFDNSSINTNLEELNFIKRHDIQFHWKNDHYYNFEDFLSYLKPKKRKNILQERKKLHQNGWTFERLLASDMTEELWILFYKLYCKTFEEKAGWAQLNLTFFKGLSKALPKQCLVVFAKNHGEIKAGSLFFVSNTHLYGRYWGSLVNVKGLHFETCYYQGIELAIELGLQTFEPGAQGEHKLARGFEPVKTTSYHWITDESYRKVIARWSLEQNLMVQQRFEILRKHSAYKIQSA